MFNYTFDYDAVIAELGIESSDADFKEHVIKRVSELVDTRAGMVFQDALSDDEVLELSKLTDNREAAQEFLIKRFPDYKEVYDRILAEVVTELKSALA